MENQDSKPQPSQQLGKWRFLVGIVALLIIMSVIIFKLRQPAKEENEEAESIVVSVQTALAEKKSIAAEVSAVGTIAPRAQATISPKLSGQITHMEILKNRQVQANQLLVSIESRDLQAQRAETLAQLEEAKLTLQSLNKGVIPQTTVQNDKALQDARANVVTAKTLYERRKDLFEKGGIAQKDVESAQLSLTLAENELRLAENTTKLRSEALTPSDRALAELHIKQAEQKLATLDVQINYASIYAPFSGIITDQFQFQGEFASSGAKLLTIADTSEVIVKVSFADTVAKQLKVGDKITILPSDLGGESFTGQISLISNSFDPQSRTVEVWGNFKNEQGKLHIGSIAQAIVTTAQVQETVVIPVSAVTLEASNETAGTVIVVDNQSIAHETKVTIGIRASDQIQITSGLQGGETVAIQGNYALPDGTKVQIVKPGAAKKKDDKADETGENDAKPSKKQDDKAEGKEEK